MEVDPNIVGKRVTRKSILNGSEIVEYGVIVAAWYCYEISDIDCYIAFTGSLPPRDQKPSTKPYILRYAYHTLEEYND